MGIYQEIRENKIKLFVWLFVDKNLKMNISTQTF